MRSRLSQIMTMFTQATWRCQQKIMMPYLYWRESVIPLCIWCLHRERNLMKSLVSIFLVFVRKAWHCHRLRQCRYSPTRITRSFHRRCWPNIELECISLHTGFLIRARNVTTRHTGCWTNACFSVPKTLWLENNTALRSSRASQRHRIKHGVEDSWSVKWAMKEVIC